LPLSRLGRHPHVIKKAGDDLLLLLIRDNEEFGVP
jgi:hypothetical protein